MATIAVMDATIKSHFPTEERPFTIRTSELGCIHINAAADWSDVKELLEEIKAETDGQYRIEAEQVGWAGFYEVLLAAWEFSVGVSNIAGGIAGVLALYVQRHPDKPITVVASETETIVITGKPLSQEESEQINRLFSDNDRPPGEAGESYGPGSTPIWPSEK